ncbi:acetate/propionate family kinase [Paraburkholderia phosphatilytica]|uniref:acetate/propionate family kinase n=1 Tax=Paraburkholderia phosphatilytica TaxID=2282883 RepID=UPI000E4A66D3|nr:acetate/propionate family kinase [Paraburkholderia phosphatilytica]
MSAPLLLTFNAGSSSIKIGVFSIVGGAAVRIGDGLIDLRRAPLRLHLDNCEQRVDIALESSITDDLHDAIDETLGWFAAHFPIDRLVSVGHRVVHGGDRFAGPVVLDDGTVAAIDALVPLAPLHQPQCLRLIRALRHLRPHLAQSASFDTAFHRTQTDTVRRFALPRALFDEGIKRYGFHGLSYRFVLGELAWQLPQFARGNIVAAHLGSGASLAAFEAGISRDSSMGFSTLDGIPMATRCGALDAGVVLHLIRQRGMSPADVEAMLYGRSGLLGVSGISADSRELLASTRPEAREALDLFAFRIAGEAARLATTLGGLDGLVFTAGIGEHQPEVRAAICARLAWLGIDLDAQANERNARVISSERSRIAVIVLPTDEEQIIADEAVALLHQDTTTR